MAAALLRMAGRTTAAWMRTAARGALATMAVAVVHLLGCRVDPADRMMVAVVPAHRAWIRKHLSAGKSVSHESAQCPEMLGHTRTHQHETPP